MVAPWLSFGAYVSSTVNRASFTKSRIGRWDLSLPVSTTVLWPRPDAILSGPISSPPKRSCLALHDAGPKSTFTRSTTDLAFATPAR